MQFNFDFIMYGLDGKALVDQEGAELHAGKTAASLIMQYSQPGTDVMKIHDWATQLYKTGTIDLDKNGQQQFKQMIEMLPNVWLSVRGHILQTLLKRQDELTAK